MRKQFSKLAAIAGIAGLTMLGNIGCGTNGTGNLVRENSRKQTIDMRGPKTYVEEKDGQVVYKNLPSFELKGVNYIVRDDLKGYEGASLVLIPENKFPLWDPNFYNNTNSTKEIFVPERVMRTDGSNYVNSITIDKNWLGKRNSQESGDLRISNELKVDRKKDPLRTMSIGGNQYMHALINGALSTAVATQTETGFWTIKNPRADPVFSEVSGTNRVYAARITSENGFWAWRSTTPQEFHKANAIKFQAEIAQIEQQRRAIEEKARLELEKIAAQKKAQEEKSQEVPTVISLE